MGSSGGQNWTGTLLVSEANQGVGGVGLEKGSEHALTCRRNPDKGTFGDFFAVVEIDGFPVRDVGVKVFHAEGEDGPREEYGRLCALGSSPFAPKAYALGTIRTESQDSPAILEERVAGVSLSGLYAALTANRAGSAVSPEKAFELGKALSNAVASLYLVDADNVPRSVVNRDLGTDNLRFVVGEDGSVAKAVVIDFGQSTAEGRLTATPFENWKLSNPAHGAPEMFSTDPRRDTTKADVWSIGSILYEARTGRVPFQDAILRHFEDRRAGLIGQDEYLGLLREAKGGVVSLPLDELAEGYPDDDGEKVRSASFDDFLDGVIEECTKPVGERIDAKALFDRFRDFERNALGRSGRSLSSWPFPREGGCGEGASGGPEGRAVVPEEARRTVAANPGEAGGRREPRKALSGKTLRMRRGEAGEAGSAERTAEEPSYAHFPLIAKSLINNALSALPALAVDCRANAEVPYACSKSSLEGKERPCEKSAASRADMAPERNANGDVGFAGGAASRNPGATPARNDNTSSAAQIAGTDAAPDGGPLGDTGSASPTQPGPQEPSDNPSLNHVLPEIAAMLLAQGHELERDWWLGKALDCYKMASALGCAEASREVGRFYEDGVGVLMSERRAKWWRRLSSLQEDGKLAEYLSNIDIYPGGHMSHNAGRMPNGALLTIELCPSCGNTAWSLGQAGGGECAVCGFQVETFAPAEPLEWEDYKNYCSELIREAKRLEKELVLSRALELYKEASSLGSAEASFAVARFYREGLGLFQSQKKADRWSVLAFCQNFALPAEDRSFEAIAHVSGLLDERDSPPLSTFFFGLYQSMAMGGDSKSSLEIAKRYESGCGVEQNLGNAIQWCSQAIEKGEDAMPFLERMKNTQSFNESLERFREGDTCSAFEIAKCHETGKGIGKDLDSAIVWYGIAASGGVRDALNALCRLLPRADLHIETANGL